MEKYNSKQYPISSLCRLVDKNHIDIHPKWQRKIVWNERMKKELVHTLLKGYPINPLVLWTTNNVRICVDGKNRLSAIIEFVNNNIMVDHDGDQKRFRDLSEQQQEDFMNINIEVRTLQHESWNEKTVRDYFQLIQGGQKLNWPERINAIDNEFVDLMREIMQKVEKDFQGVLGNSCNDRFELYSYIANIISVHDIIISRYQSNSKSKSKKNRTADTNYSLMKYVLNFDERALNITDEEKELLKKHVRRVIETISSLNTLQKDEVSKRNLSIWYLITSDQTAVKCKPCIKDFTSVAYFLEQNKNNSHENIVLQLKRIYRNLVETYVANNKDASILDYYITYGKNQKQYAWTSVSKRYDIMMHFDHIHNRI